MALRRVYVDLHVHVGMNSEGLRVKMASARDMIFRNIAREASERKGIDVIGVVDCASPRVIRDIEALLESGEMLPVPGGGIKYGKTTVVLGAEIETGEKAGCSAHSLTFFPTVERIKAFSAEMGRYIKNINLGTQRARLNLSDLLEVVARHEGVLFPAHAFTPHKSIYGNCADRLTELLSSSEIREIFGLELGLSADTDMADRIAELSGINFLSNSDAHSLPKIGREYNVLLLDEPDFNGVMNAIRGAGGGRIEANYGLDPRLGKCHRTFCSECLTVIEEAQEGSAGAMKDSQGAGGRADSNVSGAKDTKDTPVCPQCGRRSLIKGVLDRVEEIADYPAPHHPTGRPPYYYQVPLEFIPGLGAKSIDKLIKAFGSEMAVLHEASESELADVVAERIAHDIVLGREGRLRIEAGGGGNYGRASTHI